MARSVLSPALTVLLGLALALAAAGLLPAPAAAGPPPDDRWVPLAALPPGQPGAVLALAVDPGDSQVVLAGTGGGELYRSANGGAAWTEVASHLGRGVSALAFDPTSPQVALAGSRGGGAWRSDDDGRSWRPDPGTAGRTVRAFAFAPGLALAGTERGVLADRQSGGWQPAGLPQVAVSALAVLNGDPTHLLAGADATAGGEPLPVFSSADGGRDWSAGSAVAGGSSLVTALAGGAPGAGPGDPAGQPLMGTNAGLFTSADGGASWQPLTGGGSLPATDVSALAPASGGLYVASDGGGSAAGGLWVSRDSGAHFSSLEPPLPAVTALAVSAGAAHLLYVATLRAGDQAALLWVYRDAGGAPQAPVAGVPRPAASGRGTPAARPASAAGGPLALLRGPEAPYLGLGLLALGVLLAALVAYLRRTRDL